MLLEWSIIARMSMARSEHTASVLTNGKVLVIGGYNSIVVSENELYDPSTERWTNSDDMKTIRRAHTATVLTNGLVLVVIWIKLSCMNHQQILG
jgi:N-acetylneuraminic acid mutarotase